MRPGSRQMFCIFALRAGIILATGTMPQIDFGAAPEIRERASAPAHPAVDLNAKNILVLHTFEANMPLNIRIDGSSFDLQHRSVRPQQYR